MVLVVYLEEWRGGEKNYLTVAVVVPVVGKGAFCGTIRAGDAGAYIVSRLIGVGAGMEMVWMVCV